MPQPSTAGNAATTARANRPIIAVMQTAAAMRSRPTPFRPDTVVSVDDLLRQGWTYSAIRRQIDARRWQRIGRAIIRHNGPLTVTERWRAALIVLGPRAVLTSFTGLQSLGLERWTRDPIHVLVPRGARVRRPAELSLRVHFTDRWDELAGRFRGRRDGPAHAALLAASSFRLPRPGCGLLAATVQQRLLRPTDLVAALERSPRLRHRAHLTAAAHDIGLGAHALSEIDFARLCRRRGLPRPSRQSVRTLSRGRRRYLDAEWTRDDGRRVVAEVDGALHLAADRWWDDQLRQNELAISDDLVLRFPSAVVRCEEPTVADQLARALHVG